ncbi:hypothetical protein [Psychroflexus sp. ALD_RP9]|uniref:hypothetical protein n=1 Tax=Psychroflexus sp. ALD_RP9 TaxID=2777186 RepID=UPI001A8C1165|nr:hypothetical protein [Psychroflexus sp. ALD_RP9]QSS96679.1 hypothetical protein IMZ30_09520 [Psychroflexus sp. ALD_RP9]
MIFNFKNCIFFILISLLTISCSEVLNNEDINSEITEFRQKNSNNLELSLKNQMNEMTKFVNSDGTPSSVFDEQKAKSVLMPFVNKTKDLLISEGISEQEIIDEFGSLDSPELALVGIAIIETQNQQISESDSPSVLDCVARAFVGIKLHEGFWSNFTNRRVLLRAVGKLATRTLGWVGAALVVYDFTDCMGWI